MPFALSRISDFIENHRATRWLLPIHPQTNNRIRGAMAQHLLDVEKTTHSRGHRYRLGELQGKTRVGAPIRPLMKSWARTARTLKVVAASSSLGLASVGFGLLVASKGEKPIPAGVALAFGALAGAGALRAARYQHLAEGLLHNEAHMDPYSFRYMLQAAASVGQYGEAQRTAYSSAKVLNMQDKPRSPR